MRNISIDYAPFKSAGFDEKNCSVSSISLPNLKQSEIAEVYLTNASTPQRYHVAEKKEIVTLEVEFIPYEGGEGLISKTQELVADVPKDNYQAEPATIILYKKDGSIDKTRQIHECIIKEGRINLNRKNEARGEPGFVRIRFFLEGLLTDAK